jgi:quinol monooxygenase YgiN
MRQLLCLPLCVALFLSSAIAQNRGPQPSDSVIHTVAYIETAPAARETAIAAFRPYRDASRREEGFVSMEFFEQTGRPGHFAILETWMDQRNSDAHAIASSKKDLIGKLQTVRLSDYDQRPYKTLSVASVATSDAQTIYVLTHVDISGPQAGVPAALQRLAETSRRESGNIRFDVLQHTMRANHFTVIEAWQNQRALDAHAAAEHTKQYRETLGPALGSPLDERLYGAIN